MLVQVIPKDSSRKFAANKIVFTFNEYVDLQNIQDNLLVSPVPKANPVVESKLRTVTVKIKASLQRCGKVGPPRTLQKSCSRVGELRG